MSAPGRPRRMLVITFSYAPMLNARAFRWSTLAAHFARSGWEVEVVTSWLPGTARTEWLEGVRVHRAGWRWAEELRGALRRERAQLASAGAPSGNVSGGVLRWLRERIWKPLYWPDSSSLWYWPARGISLELAHDRPYDALVSVSPTFTAVLVGAAVRRAGRTCRWVLDYGDPFSLQETAPPNNAALYAGLNRRVERKLLDLADAVCVTTRETQLRHAEAFPSCARKLHVIPPLLSVPESQNAAPIFAEDETVRLLYVGTLYRGLREPRFLLELVGALRAQSDAPRVELHLFGDAHQFAGVLGAWRRRLGDVLRVHGMVPRETVARAMHGASVLVNIGNDTRDQLPSKVVEYAASGKPILNIARTEADSSAAFLRGYPDALTLFDGGSPAPAQLDSVRAFLRGLPRRVPAEKLDAWLAPYRLPAIAARYGEVLG